MIRWLEFAGALCLTNSRVSSDTPRRKGLPVESPMLVSQGSYYAHRIMTDAWQHDPFVWDAQPSQVVAKVTVILKGLVLVSDDQAQARTVGKNGCVLLCITARADRSEAVLTAAINVSLASQSVRFL